MVEQGTSKRFVFRIIKAIVAVILVLAIFLTLNQIFLVKRYDGVKTLLDFYDQNKDTIDILFLGGSHVSPVSTDILWERYGFSSYVLWGSSQPFWNSYYYLLEALKTQAPTLVVLDVYLSILSGEYQDENGYIVNTSAIRLSKNRYDAVVASTPAEKRIEMFLGLPTYHERYYEITKNDFYYFPWNNGGQNDKARICFMGFIRMTAK